MRFYALLTLIMTAGLALGLFTPAGEPLPKTGPATEKRFPPLKVPKGFTATLFACDPLIEYPSVIAAGPKADAVFVAIDYMTGLGIDIVRRDEVRLVEDTDGDGYADKATVVAGGFNSIQGIAYHDGTIYVMHAPFLTAVRDTDGDGKADERKDLVTGLGLRPEDNPPRLHCANGVTVGHDGWLYLSLGDHGCDVKRPEGDRLLFQGGGILRCRPDGRDLHVFATGLRNIYDVALDEDLNVFVRDNENDGGDYMIRVCHSFFGADHGYPYHYYERPDEALTPLADLGRGSSAGGVCYLETQFPAEFRGNLFFCEWGRSIVRHQPKAAGSGFGTLKELEFAAGDPKDPYGFHPTDVVVQRDGALMVADWCDGQRPKRGRGRIYRIAHTGDEKSAVKQTSALEQLDSESYTARLDAQRTLERQGPLATARLRSALAKDKVGLRGRLHAIWALANVAKEEALRDLVKLARIDPAPRVRAQAIRAIADLADPVLTQHRLAAGRGDGEVEKKLATLAEDQDPRVVLEIIIAMGRLRCSDAPAWLEKHLTKPDAPLAHAAMQTLRRADNWPAVLKLLDEPDAKPIRAIALRAVADQVNAGVVDGLIARLSAEKDPTRRRDYADALTRVYKKPGPWTYWGYRPAPRPPNTVAWERTDAIGKVLDHVLADPDRNLCMAVLRRMQREKIPPSLSALSQWLLEDTDAGRVPVLLESLGAHPPAATRALLESVAAAKKHAPANRQAALTLLVGGLDAASVERLLTLAKTLEDGPVLAEALRHLAKRPKLATTPLLMEKLTSPDAGVRAAALEASAELRVQEAALRLPKLLQDQDARVRAAAATLVGKLGAKQASDPLLTLAKDDDPMVRRASLEALCELREPRVLPSAVAALNHPLTQLAALRCLGKLGGPDQTKAIVALAEQNPSAEVLPLALGMLSQWSEEAETTKRASLEVSMAALQGASGTMARWRASGFAPVSAANVFLESFPSSTKKPGELGGPPVPWQTLIGSGAEARINPKPGKDTPPDLVWLAVSDVLVPAQASVQFLASSNGPLRVWLNGKLVYQRAAARSFVPDADRFDATLIKGVNRLLVEVAPVKGQAEFHVRFRKKSAAANHEQLIQAALSRPGDVGRGRKLFLDLGKTQCLKCHHLGDQGERIGPDLAGIGNRFARVYLIESILEPSRTIAPSYESVVAQLKDGRIITGTRLAETPETLTLADNQGQKHALARSNIDEVRPHPVSTMPEGLERPLTTDDFVDLIAFLVSQKK